VGDEIRTRSSLDSPDAVRERVVQVLKTVYDPEIPVDIWELGLVYRVDVSEDGELDLDMTLTSPACPVAASLPAEVEEKLRGVAGVSAVRLSLVWDPAWEPSRMSEAARLALGFF